MISRIGRKQGSSQADWIATLQQIDADPDTPARAERLIEEAAGRVRSRIATVERPVYGWSGGKDSIALGIICERAGLSECLLVLSALEWPAFTRWVDQHRPAGLTVEVRDRLNLDWLARNPSMLFPATGRASRWFSITQHAGQRAYAARRRSDLLLLGRRSADGNYLGRRSELGHEYTDRGGFARYSPIADWSHEDVLTVLSAHRVQLPPSYFWPRGFQVGTGPWPARQGISSRRQGWSEVLAIDRSVVEGAARAQIPGAREALTGKGNR